MSWRNFGALVLNLLPMDGLIIAGRHGQPIMLSRFRQTNPLYSMLHTSFLSDLIADMQMQAEAGTSKNASVRDIPPVLSVPLPDSIFAEKEEEDEQDDDDEGESVSPPDLPDEALAWSESVKKTAEDPTETCISIEGGSILCHIMVGDVRFLCPVSHSIDPLIPFAFLHKVVAILQEYLIGSTDPALMTEDVICEHFDIVYELMEEMLDGAGHVLLTEVNALKDIVLPPSWLDKLIHTVGLSSSAEHARTSLASPVPWRRPNSKYAKNEVYLDIVETMDGIVNASGAALSLDVHGTLECSALLSGIPELVVKLSHPTMVEYPAWHKCIQQRDWHENRILRFIPPDGDSRLGEFRIKSAATAKSTLPLCIHANVMPYEAALGGLPFEISAEHTLDHSYDLQDVCVEWLLGNGVQGIDATTQVQTVANKVSMSSDIGSIPSLSRSTGTMVFDRKRQLMRWTIPTLMPSTMSVLRGTILSSTTHCRPMYALQVQFMVQGYSFSGLRVTSVQLEKEAYTLSKGARVRLMGDIEWRLI